MQLISTSLTTRRYFYSKIGKGTAKQTSVQGASGFEPQPGTWSDGYFQKSRSR